MRPFMRIIIILLFIAAAADYSHAAERKEIVVVMPISAPSLSEEARSSLTNSFTGELLKNKKYEFLSGKIVSDAMKAAFQKQAQKKELCDEVACLREVAGNFGTDLILSTKIVKEGDLYLLDSKIENISSGALIFQRDDECKKCDLSELKKRVKSLASRLITGETKGPLFVETPTPAVTAGGGEAGIEEVKPTAPSEGAIGPAGIYITSDPSGADVYLGDILAGTTEPAFQKLNMAPNTTVRVTLKKPEHHDLIFDVDLRPGISKYEKLKLKPAFGYLTVEGEPSDAEVYIGSSFIGNVSVKGKKLKSGKHLMTVRKKLYETMTDYVVEIKDGETTVQKINLKSAFGTVSIDSSPRGASVAIDGEQIGNTPIVMHKISHGNYTLKIAQDGYAEKEFKIKVAVGTDIRITPEQANLRKKIFNLQVFADPPEPDSEVYIDGEKKGSAPVTIEELSEGKYTIEVKTKEKSGKEEIIGRDGETKSVAVKLQPLPIVQKQDIPTQSVGMSRYTDNRDGTVTANKTGLMWQKNNDSKERNWKDSVSYCDGLTLAGYSDWRLPSKDELETLIDESSRPKIDRTFFPNTIASYCWSSTTSASDSSYAWRVNFDSGYGSDGYRSDGYYVLCVRGGQ